jgi:hypothetical protein
MILIEQCLTGVLIEATGSIFADVVAVTAPSLVALVEE